MPRPGITREQVFEATDQLTQAGHNPTVVAICKHLGGGSPNTIGPHLADWKAQAEGPVDTAEAGPTPEPVEAAMRKVWSLAVRHAQDQLQGEREALALARKEIEQERAELAAEIERLDTALEHARSEAQKAAEALDTEREAHHQTQAELQQAHSLADERANRNAEQERELHQLRTENERLRIEAATADERAAQAGELRAIFEQFVSR